MAQLAHSDNDLFQEFEIHRRYANSHLRSYFEVLDQHSSRDGLSGLLGRNPRQGQKMLLLKVISTSTIEELGNVEAILEEIIKQQKPLTRSVLPRLLSYTVSFLGLAYAVQHPQLSKVFKLGTFAGAALLTIHFVRECQKQTQLVPLQHKVRGLIRAFKNGTIRYRDLDEVLLASLD
ncbi:unnamed protein product [Fusarium graminearum]|uniref:Chromosome 1, complete genome n=1 Tax=Gibberella zeae (strain ATCC MYA-4620 / CBS 123657 / FGSC 9075 / NRRL 31084 / PH-1) TaxID=229533 RepID=A0A0E0RT21_GIBZE|nr:hypothetical protein FG05_30382 [Fusarium graminearum]KAI6771145.1 hypothetical protein HG531_010000 [Fusarium graminearum]CEF74396.1 unnamed protein product [Fusarium graminearum]